MIQTRILVVDQIVFTQRLERVGCYTRRFNGVVDVFGSREHIYRYSNVNKHIEGVMS